MRIKQESFSFINKKASLGFGGSLLKNSHAKSRRPFSSKKAIHVVMRSSLAKGELSLLHPKHAKKIKEIVEMQARKSNVRIYRFANSGNHLHLLFRAVSSHGLRRFMRAVSGLIARLVLNTERGRPLPKDVSFWDQRPFSRLVTWGREYAGVTRYLLQNTLEALGFIAYQPRHISKQKSIVWRFVVT